MHFRPKKYIAAVLIAVTLLLAQIITPSGQGNLSALARPWSSPAYSFETEYQADSAPALPVTDYDLLPFLRRARVEPTPTPVMSAELRSFIGQVADGTPDVVRGVYVEGVLALPVIEQPEGQSGFVSREMGVITQFRSAAQRGVTGLLAHNYLSGMEFYNLEVGQEVVIVYGDGSLRRYRIISERAFQKLVPSSSKSDYIDLETGEQLTTSQVFNKYYSGDHHVTFQTCLQNRGLSNWGLTFWVAVPI